MLVFSHNTYNYHCTQKKIHQLFSWTTHSCYHFLIYAHSPLVNIHLSKKKMTTEQGESRRETKRKESGKRRRYFFFSRNQSYSLRLYCFPAFLPQVLAKKVEGKKRIDKTETDRSKICRRYIMMYNQKITDTYKGPQEQ